MKMPSRANSKKEFVKLAEYSARIARVSALNMTAKARASHIGSCLSVIDILALLFSVKLNSQSNKNDDVILSKGHAAAALYATLEAYNLLDADPKSFCENGSKIYGHVNHHVSSHIPLSTGSLGHGLPFGVGLALARKKRKLNELTIVVMSDGELNEGTTWESALISAHQELTNLIVVIDRNNIQSLGFTEQTLKLEPLDAKWISFGWETRIVNGHDFEELFDAIYTTSNKPLCVIAETVKGKGVSFMENTIEWHYKSASDSELVTAVIEIENGFK
jgi:transketolase